MTRPDGPQEGFTPVEIIIVIVVVGILAAIAVLKYIDFTNQLKTGVVNGLTMALRSAAVIAQADFSVNTSNTAAINASTIFA